ncbi:MAG: polysaccharide deacetylase family protein [Bacteroidales bacterium]|nr:polysaccharide deacetylase family protein [Bacteroidales bacterium]
MKNTIFNILSFFTFLIPVRILIKLSGIKVIYPFYHIVSDNPPVHVKHLYKVRAVKQFRKDLNFIIKYFQAINYIPEKPLQNDVPCFCLSFDDGLKECYDIISPILKEYGITATYFLNPAFVDNKDLFYKYKASILIEKLMNGTYPSDTLKEISSLLNSRTEFSVKKITAELLIVSHKGQDILNKIASIINVDFSKYLKEKEPYLTKKQISEMITNGNIIGAHSIDHPLYSKLDLNSQINQTVGSLEYVVNEFDTDEKLFAFPFTDDKISLEFFNEIFDKKHADYTFGTAGIKKDTVSQNIQRIPIELHGLSAEKTVKTEYLLYIIKRMTGKHKIKRR